MLLNDSILAGYGGDTNEILIFRIKLVMSTSFPRSGNMREEELETDEIDRQDTDTI